jgi:zinc transporter 1/2/3
MNQLAFKWISAIVIWITTFIGSSLPMCITAIRWTSRLESLAGGVFLGAGLGHLLNDAFEELHEKSEYPWAAAITLIMFAILTAVELFSYGEHDEEFRIQEESNRNPLYDQINPDSKSLESLNSTGSGPTPRQLFGQDNSQMTVPTYSLYLIMNIHSIIEGLALGIQHKDSSLIAIFCAIIGHKPVEAFALSLIILKDKPTKLLFWILVFVYTIMTPIGIAAAIIIAKEFDSPWVLGSIAAVSAGTFLFVGCHEWAEMFEHKAEWNCAEKSWHFGMFAIGILWMLLIAIVEMFEDHGHHH